MVSNLFSFGYVFSEINFPFMKKIIMCFFLLAFGSCNEKDELPGADCVGEKKDIACYQIYMPVCGCNGQTYGNDCDAIAAGVKKYTAGACN